MLPRVAVVDGEDRFVRWTDREEVHARRLPHRSVHVLIFDRARRLVVQQRQRDKRTFPLHWDVSCSGHVEEPDYLGGPDDDLREVYARAAHRELREELGVDAALARWAHFAPEEPIHYEQIELFGGVHDGPFTLQESEVLACARVTRASIEAYAPQTPTLRWITEWLSGRDLKHEGGPRTDNADRTDGRYDW